MEEHRFLMSSMLGSLRSDFEPLSRSPLFERQITQSHEVYLKGMHRKFEIFLRQIVSDSDDG